MRLSFPLTAALGHPNGAVALASASSLSSAASWGGGRRAGCCFDGGTCALGRVSISHSAVFWAKPAGDRPPLQTGPVPHGRVRRIFLAGPGIRCDDDDNAASQFIWIQLNCNQCIRQYSSDHAQLIPEPSKPHSSPAPPSLPPPPPPSPPPSSSDSNPPFNLTCWTLTYLSAWDLAFSYSLGPSPLPQILLLFAFKRLPRPPWKKPYPTSERTTRLASSSPSTPLPPLRPPSINTSSFPSANPVGVPSPCPWLPNGCPPPSNAFPSRYSVCFPPAVAAQYGD